MEGLKGKLKNWMEEYLEGRELRTVIRGRKSNWKKVMSDLSATGFSAGTNYV